MVFEDDIVLRAKGLHFQVSNLLYKVCPYQLQVGLQIVKMALKGGKWGDKPRTIYN